MKDYRKYNKGNNKTVKKPAAKQLSGWDKLVLWFKFNKNTVLSITIVVLVVASIVTGILLNSDNASEVNAELPSMLYFGSASCAPCIQQKPVVASIEKSYSDKMNVLSYDTGANDGYVKAVQYSIQYTPTIVFVDSEGKELDRLVGYNDRATIVAKMRALGII